MILSYLQITKINLATRRKARISPAFPQNQTTRTVIYRDGREFAVPCIPARLRPMPKLQPLVAQV